MISTRTRAGTAIGIGLLLALAATIGPPPSPSGEPGASLAVRLPDTVRTVVLALLALSAIILLALQRPRRPTEDEPEPSPARRRVPAWMALIVPLPLLLSLVAGWYLIWHYWSDGDHHPIEKAFTAIAELLELLALSRKPPTSVPFFDVTLAALALLFALAIFALLLVVALADRLEKWWAGRASAAAAAPPLADAPADPLDDLRAEPDARVAIVRAWGRFEHALAAARAPRAPWQTPTELMRAAVARLPLPRTPVERLTALFEIARFSDRALGVEARDAACDCLDAITAALDEDAARER